MKVPLMLRSRHHEAVAVLQEKLANARIRQAELEGKVRALSEGRKADKARLSALALRGEEHQAAANQQRLALLDRVAAARAGAFRRRDQPVPMVLGVDVEPDARTVDLADPSWRGTTLFLEKWRGLEARLQTASGGAPVPLTWFPRADPQVAKSNGAASYALQHFARDWDALLKQGHEIGLHMHPWRWHNDDQGGGGYWSQDHGDAVWMEHCLRSSIAEYRSHFGHTPPVYRGGDHYLNDALVRILEEEGVGLDMTVELLPAQQRLVETEHGTGFLPDCSVAPAHAYRPSVADFRVEDPAKKDGLGILPLTAYQGGSLRLWDPNETVDEALEDLMGHDNAPTHLAFVIRSQIADTGYWAAFEENALSLARRVREGSLEFVTATQAWRAATGHPRG
jgi:peptidoglycan/xylan/chitin deacetylase (PgdA/CDA1 family)